MGIFGWLLDQIAPSTDRSSDDSNDDSNASTGDPDATAVVTEDYYSAHITFDADAFAAYRERCRSHLRGDSLAALRKDPHYTFFFLKTLTALETFFDYHEESNTVKETFRSIDGSTLGLIHEGPFPALERHIKQTFEALDLYDPTDEYQTKLDENTLDSLGIDTDLLPEDREFLEYEEKIEIYASARSALYEETPRAFDSIEYTLKDYMGSAEYEEYLGFLSGDRPNAFRGQIILALYDIGLLEADTNGEDYLIDEDALASLGVRSSITNLDDDIYSIDEDDLFEIYEAVLTSLENETITTLDEETISAIRGADLSVAYTRPVDHFSFDWDNLTTFNRELRSVLDAGSFSRFDEQILTQLHKDLRLLRRSVGTPSFDAENVTLLEEMDSTAFADPNTILFTDGTSFHSIYSYENESITRVLSTLDGFNPFQFDDGELATLDSFYSLRERYDRDALTQTQFDRKLSSLLEDENVLQEDDRPMR